MRRTVLAVLISGLGLVGVGYAQGHGGGGGHAGGGRGNGSHGGWNHFQGGTVVVPYAVPYAVGGYGYYGPGYYNGYYDPSLSSGYVDPSAQDQPYDNGLPPVMVNPGYVPDRANPQVQEYGAPTGPPPDPSAMRMYQNRSYPYADVQGPQPYQRVAPGSDEPTIYLIAFKDHTIVQALGYWVESGTLHYVSMEHTINQASMDLIDRSLSQRLNDERNVEFKLPAR